jgi:hypothetical protein
MSDEYYWTKDILGLGHISSLPPSENLIWY